MSSAFSCYALSWRNIATLAHTTQDVVRSPLTEGIHANLARRMNIVSGFRIERRYAAGRAFSLAVEDFFATSRCVFIEAAGWWLRCGDRQLVEVQSRQLRSNQVRHTSRVV